MLWNRCVTQPTNAADGPGAPTSHAQGSWPAPSRVPDGAFLRNPFGTDLQRASWFPPIARAVAAPLRAGDFAGALSAATVLLEDLLRAASDPPREKAMRGAADLAVHALSADGGVLTRHLSKSEATGVLELVRGIFGFVRNRAHHNVSLDIPYNEVVWAIDCINYAHSVVQRLAAQTYLDPYLSKQELRSLLRVRHLSLGLDDEQEFRVVSYSRAVPDSSEGRVLVTRRENDQWVLLPGVPYARGFDLDGRIIDGLLDRTTKARLCVVGFGSMAAARPVESAVVFGVEHDAVVPYVGPPQSELSDVLPIEVRDHAGLGYPQLLTYSGMGELFERRFWAAEDGKRVPARPDEVMDLGSFKPTPFVPPGVEAAAAGGSQANGSADLGSSPSA